jgi:hypothetical protein
VIALALQLVDACAEQPDFLEKRLAPVSSRA